MKQRKFIILILILILILLFPIGGAAAEIWNYQSVDQRQQADVAIILGAATYGDKVTPVFKERINHGITLYRDGYVEKLIFTGGKTKNNALSEAAIAMQYAIEQGIPENDLLLEETSTVTTENLANAKEIMDSNEYVTAVLISDPLHMKRAEYLAEQIGLEVFLSPTPTSMYQSLYTKVPFLIRETILFIGYQMFYFFL